MQNNDEWATNERYGIMAVGRYIWSYRIVIKRPDQGGDGVTDCLDLDDDNERNFRQVGKMPNGWW